MPYVDLASLHTPAANQSAPAAWGLQVRDNFEALRDPPRCRAYNSANYSLAAGASFTLDSETLDTDGMHSTTSNTARITFNTAGAYLIVARVLANIGTGSVFVALWHQRGAAATMLDHDERPLNASLYTRLTMTAVYSMQAGDYVYVRNEAGTFSSIAQRSNPAIEAVWVSR